MNKHTPGEWELLHERHLGKTTHVVKIGTASVYYNRGIGQTEETAVANGKLIASAPELLEALEACLPVIESERDALASVAGLGDAVRDELHVQTCLLFEKMRSAIAKASGL